MEKHETLYLYILTAVLVVGYGFALAFGLAKLDTWRVEKAQEYLAKAKVAQNSGVRLQYSEWAILLHSNEEEYLLAGTAAVDLGNGRLAEKYLPHVKSGEGLLELGKAQLKQGKLDEARRSLTSSYAILKNDDTNKLIYLAGGNGQYPDVSRETNPINRVSLIYNDLISRGYPQAAIQTLQVASQNNSLGRDGFITLANKDISESNYIAAYDLLVRAKLKDAYYPQVYQQLVLVCEKLGKSDEAVQYQNFLDNLTI